MSTPLPGTGARDQFLAYIRDDLDKATQAISVCDAKAGEAQSLADNIAYFTREYTPEYLAALLVVAVRELVRRKS